MSADFCHSLARYKLFWKRGRMGFLSTTVRQAI